MKRIISQRDTIIFGFDSAWANNARGAICAVRFDKMGNADFMKPRLVSFDEALEFIETQRQGYAVSLTALDQPTIVPNKTGGRPVERVAASLVSFVGGGVQPANREGKRTRKMFGDGAPIWRFRDSLCATEAPMKARSAARGHFLIEVFPALALPSLHEDFATRCGAPKYNPQNRKKYRPEDWRAVARIVAATAKQLGITGLNSWAGAMASLPNPRKPDQDRLDAALCALIGLIWRGGPADIAAMIGDLDTGYMITPISDATKCRLTAAATCFGVPFAMARK